ncbi:hypothetical protein TRFO_03720 [Tritrichomonas foetus]|uniref:Uncharacterized protein n=1 Tax=Tritrichomonas foetus TaxID=1144522 RepID=A0A1J4KLT9_9EUKA|nr:hypothetical protein TRFO_03720 [Tritrichomonas foetus]|eukprot:OHT12098.1 hypothetical protein TRFO_03720 [Tritrichomonas foetus]
MLGNAKVIASMIDNSDQNLGNMVINLAPGGTIVIPYTMDFNDVGDSFANIYDDFSSMNPGPDENGKFIDYWNYYIQFATNKASELSEALETLAMKFPKINIIPGSLLSGMTNKLILRRNDYPLAALYSINLNKDLPAVCANNGVLDKSQWSITFGKDLVQGFKDSFGLDNDADKYIPTISETIINGESVSSDNNKCIGFKPTSIPGSAFEFVVYTSNSTYMEIMNKISIISLVNNNDLDATSKLKNKNSKNIILLCLDDTPTSGAINLQGIRQNANVFVIGIPFKAFDDIMNMIEYLNGLDDNDPNIDIDKEIYDQIFELIVKYKTYLPKVNILLGKLQTLLLIFVDFIGSNIECSNFFAFGSTFSQANQLSQSFSAGTTITETETYNSMKDLTFTNLVLLPISIDPPNLYVVDMIQFGDTEWTFRFKGGVFDGDYLEISDSSLYSINTNLVKGQLTIFSMTENVDFHIPETIKGTIIKGVGITTDFSTINVKDFPGMFTLEENKDKTSKNLFTENPIVKSISAFFMNRITHKTLKKNRKSILDTSDSTTISFTGSWEKITEVQGEIAIDVGSSPIEAQQIPDVVMHVLEVKTENDVTLAPTNTITEFSKPQIITASDKKYNFPSGHVITFTNITFHNSNAKTFSETNENDDDENVILGLSLLIGNSISEVKTEHLKISKATVVDTQSSLIVSSSIDLGPEASLNTPSLTATNTKLILRYILAAEFASIPDSVTPSSIILNYEGDGQSVDDIIDFTQYVGHLYNIKTFETENDCQKWKDMVSIDSNYKDFKNESYISVVCHIDSTIARSSCSEQ